MGAGLNMPAVKKSAWQMGAMDAAYAGTPTPAQVVSKPSASLTAEPAYWSAACEHLMAKDRVMNKLIAQCQGPVLVSRGDAFGTLARSIVGQQISTKAAQAVWDKLALHMPLPAPQALLALDEATLRACGLSARKVTYLQDLATHFEQGLLHHQAWPDMDDEAIIAELIHIRGIGRWTAEMFLMFHLLRPNVLPLDDAGLIKGISQSYFSGDPVSRSDAREVAAAWAPYRSVATWYIWRSLDPVAVSY